MRKDQLACYLTIESHCFGYVHLSLPPERRWNNIQFTQILFITDIIRKV